MRVTELTTRTKIVPWTWRAGAALIGLGVLLLLVNQDVAGVSCRSPLFAPFQGWSPEAGGARVCGPAFLDRVRNFVVLVAVTIPALMVGRQFRRGRMSKGADRRGALYLGLVFCVYYLVA